MTRAIVNGVLTEIPRFPALRLRDPCQGWVTQAFGVRSVTGIIHRGRDKANERGTDIRAMAAGVVVSTRTDSWRWVGPFPPGYRGVDTSHGGYGNNVVLDHGVFVDEAGARHQITTMYGHLEVVFVQPGQRVEAGQLIGLMGSTGISTGDHCHHEARRVADPFDAAEYMTGPPPEEDELAEFTDTEKEGLHELAKRVGALSTIADHRTGGGVPFPDALKSIVYLGSEGKATLERLISGYVAAHEHLEYAPASIAATVSDALDRVGQAEGKVTQLAADTDVWRAVIAEIRTIADPTVRMRCIAFLVRLIRDNAVAAGNASAAGAWAPRQLWIEGKAPPVV